MLEIDRNHVSIIISIASNITALVSHVIGFGCFILMSHGVNKTTPLIVSQNPPPYQVFTRFLCCFERNTLSIRFCSDHIITKNIAFSEWNNFFLWTYCWSVLILLYCVTMYFLGHFAIMKLWIALFAYMHSHLFGLSSNHVVYQTNSWPWFKNYKLLLFFRFLRKLTSRLTLPP